MIKFGVMGAGNIATKFSKALLGIGGNLYAIASRDLNKSEAFKKTYGFEKAYGSYEDMLKDSSVECVYIATPHGLHFEHMMLALKYHKHILCEKAFTLNEEQAKIVFDEANNKNLFVMEALWTRYLPTIIEVKQLISNGVIGDITKIEANFCFKATRDDESRLFAPHLGGGALLDVGIYPLTFANLFLGTPHRIESNVDLYHTGVDLSNEITLYYDQAIAHLKSSLGYNLPIEGFIYGTKGYIQIPMFIGAERASIYDNHHHLIKEIENKHIVNGMEYEILEVINCLENDRKESSLMTHLETLNILHQMDEIRKQWR
ncbi:MAG: Gfo/Idh/MocA family oxidoreductase [Acholeplasmataceae bacterium]|nr:Gfo/Idh/MocA family oxidoreductase [Acholeplasmataceae bacterium]